MSKHNASNERIKRQYFAFLKDAKGHSEATIDGVAAAIARFEEFTGRADFKLFHREQASAFKRALEPETSPSTGRTCSLATAYAVCGHLLKFFEWLAREPGYRSRLRYSDAEYFRLSRNDARVATARREKKYPTLEQMQHVITTMPGATVLQRRDRALVAFILLTGARDGAVASMKLKHVDIEGQTVSQDAREVRTKFRKTFTTFFFPVSKEARQIVEAWVTELREQLLWGPNDPLFPATEVLQDENRQFAACGLKRAHWATATPIRDIFSAAFTGAGLSYFKPHSVRDTLVELGQRWCQTPEEFKAWSANLGHEGVMTTLTSYGSLSPSRQREVIRALGEPRTSQAAADVEAIAEAVARRMRETPAK